MTGLRVYLVGGAVRDALLGLDVEERDWVVVGTTPAEMTARGFRPVESDFPVFRHPETGEEYALARRETKIGPGYKGFTVDAGTDVTLEEDLRRRDLRVNAMARAPDGDIVDPFEGRLDLEARRLRHVSPAFVEDPLRVLRAARFAARLAPLGFELDPTTLALMTRMCAGGEIETLEPDRIWRETEKALASAEPARYFEVLDACGATARLFPELTVASPASGERIDALTRCARTSSDPALRFTAWAIAGGRGVAAREQALATLGERLRLPRGHRELFALAAFLLTGAAAAGDAGGLSRLLARADAFRRADRFRAALTACHAACLSDAGASGLDRIERAWLAAAGVEGATLAAEGHAGAALGAELSRRRRAAIEAALENEPNA